MDETEMCQCKSGGLVWVAAVSPPDICALFAKIGSRINSLWGSDVYRSNELALAAEARQQATALKYASASQPLESLGFEGRAKDDPCKKRGKFHWMAGCSL